MSFPCPLCHTPCPVRLTRKRRPYLVCDACGVQMFVRYPAGIRRLEHAARGAASTASAVPR